MSPNGIPAISGSPVRGATPLDGPTPRARCVIDSKHWRVFWIVLAAIILFCVAVDFGPPAVGCSIKGNIQKKTGERIYHVPGQAYYSKTRVDWLRGERWFCSEATAQSAGWRRSRV